MLKVIQGEMIEYNAHQDRIDRVGSDRLNNDGCDWLEDQIAAGATITPVLGWEPYTHRVDTEQGVFLAKLREVSRA